MNMNKRQLEIVNLLRQRKLNTKELSQKFGISRRTIFNDLNIIEENLIGSGFKLVRNDKDGFYILKKPRTDSYIIDVEKFLMDNRKLEIIYHILYLDERNIEDLAESLYVSDTTLLNELKIISDIFNDFNLNFYIKNKEIHIESTEIDMQSAMMKFNEFIYKELKEIVIDINDIDKNYYQVIKFIYGEDLVLKAKSILYDYVNTHTTKLAEYYFDNIMSVMIVLIYRKLNNKDMIEYNFTNFDVINLNDALDLIKQFESTFNVLFTSQEINYIAINFKANTVTSNNNVDYGNSVKNFIDKLSDILNIDLTNDEILLTQLTNHFSAMILRLNNGVIIDNPFLAEIKKEFNSLFNAIWMTILLMDDEFDVKFNDQEIGLVTIHIQSAIERMKYKTNVMVIHESRAINSSYVLNRLKNTLQNSIIYFVDDEKDYIKEDFPNIEIIVSTANLNNTYDVPVISISPLVTDFDLSKVNESYKFINSIKNNFVNSDAKKIIDKYFIEANTFLNHSFESKEQVLDFVGKHLESRDLVLSGFIQSVKSREKLGNTELNNLVSIPHGIPSFVKDSSVFIISFRDDLLWTENKIKIMFLLSISKDDATDIKSVLNIIQYIANDSKLVNELAKQTDFDEFIKTLKSSIVRRLYEDR